MSLFINQVIFVFYSLENHKSRHCKYQDDPTEVDVEALNIYSMVCLCGLIMNFLHDPKCICMNASSVEACKTLSIYISIYLYE